MFDEQDTRRSLPDPPPISLHAQRRVETEKPGAVEGAQIPTLPAGRLYGSDPDRQSANRCLGLGARVTQAGDKRFEEIVHHPASVAGPTCVAHYYPIG